VESPWTDQHGTVLEFGIRHPEESPASGEIEETLHENEQIFHKNDCGDHFLGELRSKLPV
jgi:hypothetical protein